MTDHFRQAIRTNRDRRWRRAMLQAIRTGSRDAWDYIRKTPRHAGLHAIRDFEAVNGIAFDPLDRSHVDRISCMGRDARFLTILQKRMGVAG